MGMVCIIDRNNVDAVGEGPCVLGSTLRCFPVIHCAAIPK